jgi:ribonuclease T1
VALERAREVLAAIEAQGGEALAGYVGGRAFHNRERRLPAGRYREYDLHPRIPGQDRGPERLVIERTTGRAYYTGDHYRTFVPLN